MLQKLKLAREPALKMRKSVHVPSSSSLIFDEL